MTGFFYNLLLCEVVFQIGEGGFDAGVEDQILVALIVAGEVASPMNRALYSRVASRLLELCGIRMVDERGPENEDVQRSERRSSEDTEW
jgi:hypothetical protein